MRKEIKRLADKKLNIIFDPDMPDQTSDIGEEESSEEDTLGPDLNLDQIYDGETEYELKFVERYNKWLCYEGLFNSAQRHQTKIQRSNSGKADYTRAFIDIDIPTKKERGLPDDAKSQVYNFSTFPNICFTESKISLHLTSL